jgi:hypothetical protein
MNTPVDDPTLQNRPYFLPTRKRTYPENPMQLNMVLWFRVFEPPILEEWVL